MSLLNNTCTYAIRAALYVAAAAPATGSFVSTRKIAEDLDVPFAFLTKVLQGLAQSGVLVSQRGANGGVALSQPADQVTLLDILTAVGGDGVFRECLLGLPSCSDETPCAIHVAWRDQRARLFVLFEQTSLDDLVGQHDSAVRSDVFSVLSADAGNTETGQPASRKDQVPNPAALRRGRRTRQ